MLEIGWIQGKDGDMYYVIPKNSKVGRCGAIASHDLFYQRIKNVNFSWKEVLNFDGITGPYE